MLRRDKEGSVRSQRPANIAVEYLRLIRRRLLRQEWIGGIKNRVVDVEKELAMQLVSAGLGEDFNSAISKLVVLRRKRVLINTNLADRRFRGQLPAGEPINVDLASVRSGRRTGHRL